MAGIVRSKKVYSYSKLEKLIIYICYRFISDPSKLGSVKLNKILWFSDVESLDRRGKTVTEEYEYTAQVNGPVLTAIPGIMRRMRKRGIIQSTQINTFSDSLQWIYSIMDRERALACIKDLERDDTSIVDQWINYARNNTVKEIVRKAHGYSWWDKVTTDGPIPVHLALIKGAVNARESVTR